MSTAALLDEQFLQLAFVGQLEAITFHARRTDADGDAAEQGLPIENAHPAPVEEREQNFDDVVLNSATRPWVIRKSDLDSESVTPREGDVIRQADGTEWSIRSITLRSMNTRYRFVCTKGRL